MGVETSGDVVTPVKQVGLFQDPHFIGIVNQIVGVILFGASHLALLPSPVQPYFAAAGGIIFVVGSAFHVKGLYDPASTQTPPATWVCPTCGQTHVVTP